MKKQETKKLILADEALKMVIAEKTNFMGQTVQKNNYSYEIRRALLHLYEDKVIDKITLIQALALTRKYDPKDVQHYSLLAKIDTHTEALNNSLIGGTDWGHHKDILNELWIKVLKVESTWL